MESEIKMVVIRSDIPLPGPRSGISHKWNTVLDKLEVGDSFEFQGNKKEISHFHVIVFRARASLGKKFTVRVDNMSGVRCWRTA